MARAVAPTVNHQTLVDGHNAMHRLRLAGAPVETLRERLVARVRAAAPRGATVFFDGHPSSGAFGGTEDRGVTVRYSGDREADEAIVEHVREARHPRRLVVVTDDLELARRAEQIGASSMRVAQFFADVSAPEAPEKPVSGGFCAADFGLPDEIDLTRAAPEGALPALPRRTPRVPRPRS